MRPSGMRRFASLLLLVCACGPSKVDTAPASAPPAADTPTEATADTEAPQDAPACGDAAACLAEAQRLDTEDPAAATEAFYGACLRCKLHHVSHDPLGTRPEPRPNPSRAHHPDAGQRYGDVVEMALDSSGLDPRRLVVELTENAILENRESAEVATGTGSGGITSN